MKSEWDYWRNWLAGKDTSQFPLKDGYLGAGYFHDRDFNPVAIFPIKMGDSAHWVTVINGRQFMGEMMAARTFAEMVRVKGGGTPITRDAYLAKLAGSKLPEEERRLESRGVGHNAPPPEDYETIHDAVEEVRRSLDKLLSNLPLTRQAAMDVAALKRRAADLEGMANDIRKREKLPHDNAAAAVQARWKPLVDEANSEKVRAANAGHDYLLAEAAAARAAAAAAAQAEHGRHLPTASQAEDSAVAGAGVGGDLGDSSPPFETQDAWTGQDAPQKAQIGGLALTSRRKWEVADLRTAVAWLLEQDPVPGDFMDGVLKAIRRINKAGGVIVPGTTQSRVTSAR